MLNSKKYRIRFGRCYQCRENKWLIALDNSDLCKDCLEEYTNALNRNLEKIMFVHKNDLTDYFKYRTYTMES